MNWLNGAIFPKFINLLTLTNLNQPVNHQLPRVDFFNTKISASPNAQAASTPWSPAGTIRREFLHPGPMGVDLI